MLKINKIFATCDDLKLISANEILKYDIKAHITTELLLEDESVIIFEESKDYFDFIHIGIIKHDSNNEYVVNFDELNKYHKINEDVVGYKYKNRSIIEVDEDYM